MEAYPAVLTEKNQTFECCSFTIGMICVAKFDCKVSLQEVCPSSISKASFGNGFRLYSFICNTYIRNSFSVL